MRRLGVLLVLILLSGCGGTKPAAPAASPAPTPSPTPTAFTLTGTVNVPADGYNHKKHQSCISDDGYTDVGSSTQVIVSDEASNRIAIGALSSGTTDDRDTGDYIWCSYKLIVPDVPEGKTIYSVHVGNQARGELSYKREQLDDPIALTIG